MTRQDRLSVIYDKALQEMKANNVEDTTENRYLFLTGMRDAWLEDGDEGSLKALYLITIELEIARLKRAILFSE